MRGSSRTRSLAAALAVAALAVTACARRVAPEEPKLFEKTVTAMGTFVTVETWGTDAEAATASIDAAIAKVSALEALLSRFDPESDVSRVNAAAPGDPVEVSPETAEVLALAAGVSERTGGAFDITVGPLVRLWKDAAAKGEPPDAAEIAAARLRVGAGLVSLDGREVTVRHEGVSVDLSAVAKGYVAAKAAQVLKEAGFDDAFVNAGGDIAFLGSNPDGSPWRVGIADPRDDTKVFETIYVRDMAVVTSGNYEQYEVIGGRHYSHIIDPRTGMPLEGGAAPASVTTICKDAATADAWATGLSVLGRDGRDAAAKAGVEFLMLFVEAGKVTRFESDGFARFTKPQVSQ